MTQNNNTSVCVIIPNYNGRDLLDENIPSLLAALHGIEFQIIVVDDCSSDDSVLFLENNYPDIRIIKNSENLGFSATCNKGIRIANKELICITNTDVTFTDEYFTNAIKHFSSPGVFAVKGDIINYRKDFHDVIIIEKTSLLYYKRGFLRFNQKVKPKINQFKPGINSQFVLLGCCFVCRCETLQKLNGYDEIYSPFYWEDADLAQRALQNGYKLVYDSECKVYHKISSTISAHRSNTRRRLVSNRNKFIFTWRHLHDISDWITHIFYTTLNLLTRWVILDWKYYVAFTTALYSLIKKSLHKGN